MANRATAAAGPVAKRSSPRARTAAARAAAQAAHITAVEPPVAAAAAAAVAAVQSEQKVDEAQVQAAFGAHAHHSSANDSVADLSLPVTTAATSMPIVSTAATAAVTTMPSDTVSLQALAQQQDEYQRKLKQLQQQHELQQQQWQMRQQAALQQQKMQLEQAERQDRMQQIQQKLHERIQLKQMHGSSGSPSLVASPGAAGQTQATQQLRQAIIHREEKEMAQSLAEQQMQLYKAMVRDLEMQSGIPMTPMPSPAISGGTGGFGAELIPAPILPGTMALDASTTKAYEDFQRARQEQQLRLQQYQHIQHASTTGGGGGSPSVVRTQSVPASNDLVRQQMVIEQERLRVLQAQEMHQQQQQQVVHSREPQVSAQEQLLIQQHDILRQQQILQTLLQRQQFERQQQQQTAAARSQQPQQQKVSTAKKTSAATSSASTSASPGEGVLPPPPAKKRKKAATSPESQMESLVRELIRLSNAGNAIEMRTSLDKMTAWVHRSFDPELLKFAQRDFRDIVLAKRPSLMQANQWTSDIQVKCEYIIEKIAQVIMAVSVQHPGKATEGVTLTTTTTTSSTDQANAIRLAAKEHAYAALKAQMTQQQQQKGKGGGAAAKASTQPANISSSAATTDEKKPKQPLLVDLSLIDPKQKAAALSASVEPKSEALIGTEGAGQASAAAAMSATTTTPSAASMATKAAKATPSVPKSVSLSTPLPSAPATATPLSPQLVQQLYEVDLTSRSCAVNEEEGEDKLYIPVKSIAKVMRRALPDDHGSSSSQVTAKGSGTKSSGSIDIADVAVKTEHSSTAAQGATDGVKEIKENDGDEEMKTGGDGEEEESKPSSSSTHVASISLAALALQKRQELVERNLQQSGQAPIKIDDDAAAFMQECVTEFILYLTSEAKDHWSIDKKKTNSLLGTHVVQGMDNLGFSTYARVLDTFNAKIKKVQDAQTQKRVEKKLQDKKLKQQQKLLEVAEAKARAAAAKVAVDTAASASTAEAGSVTIKAVGTAVTSATPDVGAASETSATTTVTTTTTTTTSSTQHELELMAREDLSTTQ